MGRFLILVEIWREGGVDIAGNLLYISAEDYTFVNPAHVERIRSTQLMVKCNVDGEEQFQPHLCYEIIFSTGRKLLCYPEDPEETFCNLTGRNTAGDAI